MNEGGYILWQEKAFLRESKICFSAVGPLGWVVHIPGEVVVRRCVCVRMCVREIERARVSMSLSASVRARGDVHMRAGMMRCIK